MFTDKRQMEARLIAISPEPFSRGIKTINFPFTMEILLSYFTKISLQLNHFMYIVYSQIVIVVVIVLNFSRNCICGHLKFALSC